MKKEKLKKILVILLMLVMLSLIFTQNIVNASSLKIKEAEYTTEYKNWLKLSKEEREKTIQPTKYKVTGGVYKTSNPFKIARMAGSSLESKFTLRDYIPENTVVKNQKNTNSCWAFSSLAALESNLALRDYYDKKTAKVYDFSERHMEYATTREFANGQINEKGFARKVGSGGNFYISIPYLTNGLGAIEEKDMPFENNEDTISLDKIQNKKVTSQVYDTVLFNANLEISELKKQMKNHIKNYGAIDALIHGDSSIANGECYNNTTGAIYCNDESKHRIDHAVAIIGWDDDYAVENFNEKSRPTSKGAWIIKNSWGTEAELGTLEEGKTILFEQEKEYFKEQGINSASEIPDDIAIKVFTESGCKVENNIIKLKIGDNGIMYISYEDVNVYQGLSGIVKASNKTDYDNIYQYNELGNHYVIEYTSYTSTTYLANIFEKKTQGKEYLTQVSIFAPQKYTCKVYVNPNGDSKAKSDLQLVQLKAGESETFEAGYHTLEFLEPIEIKSDKFVVVIEIKSDSNTMYACLEANDPKVDWDDVVKTESGKCFVTDSENIKNNNWMDLSQLSSLSADIQNGDSTIKAFTVSQISDDSLKNIQITTPPTKTSYIEGQDFEKAGMVVKANYNNGESKEITDYTITDGTNLKNGQTSVTIEFEGKKATQAITVEKNSVVSIKVTTEPTKTTYYEGENFDKKGMVVEATYKDGSKKDVTDYTVKDGEDLKLEQTDITIEYEGVSTKQQIEVKESNVASIVIKTAPTKTTYYEGENFDKTGMVVEATYKDDTKEEVTDYTIENGENLKLEQTDIIINYRGKEAKQTITVKENSLNKIEVKTPPTKTTYFEGESFDKTGMVVEATYERGNTQEVTDYTIEDGDNLKIGQKTVTISYKEKTTTQQIEVKEKPVEQPKNSNFSKAKAIVKKAQGYYYFEKDKENYANIEIEINGIEKNSGNDKYEYYYYLSTKQAETSISDWIKIEKGEIVDGKLKFNINSKDVKNYFELTNSDVIYLYIKEVATKGEIQKALITDSMKVELTTEIEMYVDDVKVDNNNQNLPDNKGDNADNTVADKNLPNAGEKIITLIIIAALLMFATIKFIKFIKLKDIK